MVDFVTKTHDTTPAIGSILYDEDDEVIDLTGATVEFVMKLANGTVVIDNEATIAEATEGKVFYNWIAEDTEEAGIYLAEWKVTFPDGSKETFPRDGYIEIRINSSLD